MQCSVTGCVPCCIVGYPACDCVQIEELCIVGCPIVCVKIEKHGSSDQPTIISFTSKPWHTLLPVRL